VATSFEGATASTMMSDPVESERPPNLSDAQSNADSPETAPVSQDGEASPQNRVKLQFAGLKDRRSPSGFMHVDEALDRVGAHRFPVEWGRSAVWKEHPFRYEEEKGRFRTYRARQNEASPKNSWGSGGRGTSC